MTTVARHPSFRRNVSVLAGCQALFFMANTVVVSTAGLVGLAQAPSPTLATLPLGLQFVGTMLTTMPASQLMRRSGRRVGLIAGTGLGIASGLLACLAILQQQFLLFCIAGMLYGGFGAFMGYLRFTAADAADAAGLEDPAAGRGRAIAWVMAGGVIAAVLGPELAKATRELLAPVLFAGCYLAVACLAAGIALLLLLLDLPHVRPQPSEGQGRPLGDILRQPGIVLAFTAALVGFVTMNLLMTATPLAMLACGLSFADSAWVIQWHVLGMFLPSFLSVTLIARLGAERMILLGVLLNLACIAVSTSGLELAQFTIGLFLLGVGWNLMFVGGTTLLTSCYRPSEKAKVQGLNDFLMFTMVGLSALSAGVLHELLGWQTLNFVTLPALLAVPLAMLLCRRIGATARAG